MRRILDDRVSKARIGSMRTRLPSVVDDHDRPGSLGDVGSDGVDRDVVRGQVDVAEDGTQPQSTTACAHEIQVKDGRTTSDPGGRSSRRTAMYRLFEPLSSMAKSFETQPLAELLLEPLHLRADAHPLCADARGRLPDLVFADEEPKTEMIFLFIRWLPSARRVRHALFDSDGDGQAGGIELEGEVIATLAGHLEPVAQVPVDGGFSFRP